MKPTCRDRYDVLLMLSILDELLPKVGLVEQEYDFWLKVWGRRQ